MWPEELHILFIGGSNFVIRGGIPDLLPVYLQDLSGRKVASVRNLAIGGTDNMCGLHQVLRENIEHAPNVVVIEYAVNDGALFRGNSKLWRSSYAALLQTVHARWPNATRAVVLLGRRDGSPHAPMQKQSAELAGQLGAVVINIYRLMHSRLFRETKMKAFYRDASHLESPRMTNFAALYCAGKIMSSLAKPAPQIVVPDDLWFDQGHCNIRSLLDLAPPCTFKNSRYTIEAATLEGNGAIQFELPGSPIGLKFVAAQDSGSLLIDVDGERAIIHTSHAASEPGNREFAFLIRHASFHWLKQPTRRRRTRVSMRPICRTDPEWRDDIVRAAHSMVESTQAKPRVYVTSLMYVT